MFGSGCRRRGVLVAAIVWALATTDERAIAQTSPAVVVVRTTDAPEGLRDRVLLAVEARLREHGRTAYSLPSAFVPESLELRLAQAIADYHALEPERAGRELESIVDSFDRTGFGLSRASLLDLFAYLALVDVALGDTAGANDAIDRALAVDPGFEPTPSRFPPAFRAKVDARRGAARSAVLRLVVAPSGARVTLDGVELTSGGDARSVVVGVHVLRVEARHHRPSAERITVPAEGLERVVALASDPIELLRDGGPASEDLAALRGAAVSIGAALLVVDVVADGSSIRVALVDDGEAIERAASFDPATDPAEILDRLYVSEAQEPEVDATVDPVAPGAATRPRANRRRRRIIAAATAAAATTALAFGLGFGLAGRDRFVGSFQRDAR